MIDLPTPVVQEMAPASVAAEAVADATVLAKLRQAMPSTKIVSVVLSQVPGFYKVELQEGRIAYTDKFARYFIVGIIFDLEKGKALDGALDASSQKQLQPTSE